MVPSLVHVVNKTLKHWHCCIFQIVFSIPIYPLQRGFYPLKIGLIPLNLKRVVYCFTMGVQKKENRADLPPVSKCSGNPDINSSAFTEFPSKPESRKKTSLYTGPQDPTTIWCSSAQNVSIGSIQSAKISNWKRASWNIQELLDVLNVD